jgi:ABC-type multidrug transport system fused ATPase/permease subunit
MCHSSIFLYDNIVIIGRLSYIADRKPKDGWPLQGVVIFYQVFLSYSKNEPPVLKNVSFTLKPAEKVTFLISIMWISYNENYNEN